MTRAEAIAELHLIRVNVERVMNDVRNDSRSQKWRNERLMAYERRLEALTFAIEAIEDMGDARI